MLEFLKNIFGFKQKDASLEEEKKKTDGYPIGNLSDMGSIINVIIMEKVDDLIASLQKDYSEIGYRVALELPDLNHAKKFLQSLKARYMNDARRIEVKYKRKIEVLSQQIKTYEMLSYFDMKENAMVELENVEKEMDLLQKLKNEIYNEIEDGAFMHVKNTFLTGFERGMIYVARLNNNGNLNEPEKDSEDKGYDDNDNNNPDK